jgi:hypothetical protein
MKSYIKFFVWKFRIGSEKLLLLSKATVPTISVTISVTILSLSRPLHLLFRVDPLENLKDFDLRLEIVHGRQSFEGACDAHREEFVVVAFGFVPADFSFPLLRFGWTRLLFIFRLHNFGDLVWTSWEFGDLLNGCGFVDDVLSSGSSSKYPPASISSKVASLSSEMSSRLLTTVFPSVFSNMIERNLMWGERKESSLKYSNFTGVLGSR